ncbi:16S rRNA (cytosine(1402)-N(4))-methyltransferase RsmH [Patescibacteria group bacterium]|nr:16S rRNA (cytosine(1402)-N(4))-methyltransferase RsmH [Patescibacteria group bacterium]MBU1016173.1 16S rRNA (cytosine(1402)-N(4))-methyltransferase RsmH [Patescibacteria group bacterium]MBU1685354.1 16S rRNA (cytosine(1402)-N(4))-methyltransferase RsmH [Patescibacteria group bacterium]MBU1938906.1 16S rRNA (cytosine(1402)-N(4))-methyltransferase RsmH [Patescibacteria group bacterium]
MTELSHTPVLLSETLDLLNLKANKHVIDATLGLGGHSLEILKRIGPRGKLMAFDQDERNLKEAKKRLKKYEKQITFVHSNFEHLAEFVSKYRFQPDAILFDLGLSSPHIEDPERGFSFMKEGPLDMRYDLRQKLTAEIVVNSYSEKDLADILFYYGEERRSRVIAKRIVHARKNKRITSTLQLVRVIGSTIKTKQKPARRGGIHPATLTFQALRIYVNRELEVLEKTLEQALKLLKKGGRLVVISYHSLEDRIVKNFFRDQTRNCICPKELPMCQCQFEKKLYILTRKPIIPSGIEVSQNPRSRSAKLRGAERL